MPSSTCAETRMTSGLSGLIFVRADETFVVCSATYSVLSSFMPCFSTSAAPPFAAVFEKPSSAEMIATVFGTGFAPAAIALTIVARYDVAGESTANVVL